MNRFDLCRRARRDLALIHEYIQIQQSEERADAVIREILATILSLTHFSGRGTRRDELQRGLLSYSACNFLIFYRIKRWGVQVSRVVHGSRDLPAVFPKRRKKRK
jgi:plasmid stabilization system protein ParE